MTWEPPDTPGGDYDGDDDEDLAAVSFTGDIVIVENVDGRIMDYDAETFKDHRTDFKAPDDRFMGAHSIKTVDLNGDEFDDLIVGTGSGIRVLFGAEKIADMEEKTVLNEEAVTAMATGDFDGDGIVDVAAVCRNRSCVAFLSMDEESGELKERVFVRVPGVRHLATGDLDGDQQLDLIGVGDVLWTALSSRAPREVADLPGLESREKINGLVINEILARNEDIPLGIDFDKQADYVELYNGSDSTIALQNWVLRLNQGDEEKTFRVFSPEAIKPGKHLMLICSKTRRSSLHTGFRLPGTRATLTLLNPNGEVVDEVTYPDQQDDIAYSRYEDGLKGFIFNPLPTPNLQNRDGGLVRPDLEFSGFESTNLSNGEEPLRFTARAGDDIGVVSVYVVYQRIDLDPIEERRVVLFDDGRHGDGGFLDGVFSNTIDPLPPGAEIQFYLEAVDLTGATISVPSDPFLSADGNSVDVLSIGAGTSVPLVINEVMADNVAGVGPVKAGLDYIEIYNRGDFSVSLEGLSLAEDFFTAPEEIYNFPSGMLQPGESVIVFAGGGEGTENGLYHAPFQVGRDGSQIILLGTAKGGARTVIDSVSVPPLGPDKALVRLDGVWRKGTPSPNRSNLLALSLADLLKNWDGFAFDSKGQTVRAELELAGQGIDYEVVRQIGTGPWEVVRTIRGQGAYVSLQLPPGESGKMGLRALPPRNPEFDLSVLRTMTHGAEFRAEIMDPGSSQPEFTLFYGTSDHEANEELWPFHTRPSRRATSFHFEVGELAADRLYVGRLRATNEAGDFWSDPVFWRTAASGLPVLGKPGFSDIFPSQARFQVEFLEPANELGTVYSLYFGHQDGLIHPDAWELPVVVNPEGNSLTGILSGLEPGTPYVARVRASNGEDETWSPAGTFTTMSMKEALDRYLVLSEFMYHPSEITPGETADGYRTSDFEWMELYNAGPVPLDLSEVSFQNAVDFDFQLDARKQTIEPGGFLIVVANEDGFRRRYGPKPEVAGQWCGPFNCKTLSNSGQKEGGASDRIILAYRNAETLIEVAYDDDGLWPSAPDGNGVSLEMVDPTTLLDPSSPASWRASTRIGGTPGGFEFDSQFDPAINALFEGLRLTTISYRGDDEFLEFSNIGQVPLDLSRLKIDVGVRFDFSESSILELNLGTSVFVVRDKFDFDRSFSALGRVAGEFDKKLGSSDRLVVSYSGVTLMDFSYVAQDGDTLKLANLEPFADLNDPNNWLGVWENEVFGLIDFSRNGGVFSASFSLALTSNQPDVRIEFRLGSEETDDSWKVYDGPLTILRSEVVTARAVKEGVGPVGVPRTEVYIRQLEAIEDGEPQVISIDLLNPFAFGRSTNAALYSGKLEVDGLISFAPIGPESGPPYQIRFLQPDGQPRDVEWRGPVHLNPGSDWLLLPLGSTSLRNLAFHTLSRNLGHWAPGREFVEFYLNRRDGLFPSNPIGENHYEGNYLVMETPSRSVYRLDLEPLRAEANAEPEVSGGYLFRLADPESDGWKFEGGGETWDLIYPPKEEKADRAHQAEWLSAHLNHLFSVMGDSDSP
ncbi:MAG: lamin tail domain-containing protein, partial [Verrucomicrobiota bacterium]